LNGNELDGAGLGTAMAAAGTGLAAANALCIACVELLPVSGAAISLMFEGASRGTFGSSGELSRRLDELQFTYGEGPCLDAVAGDCPVLVADLAADGATRWPAFTDAVLQAGVRAVFALPVSIAAVPVGAIDFFCREPGALDPQRLEVGLRAAELAALPLLDLMGAACDWTDLADGGTGWPELASLERVEVYQATGMIVAQLDINPAEALVRLRAYAFAHSQTASEVAWSVVNRQLSFRGQAGTGRP
jgi:hypothetical protein